MSADPLPSTWRDPILAQFTPAIAAVARLTVVADTRKHRGQLVRRTSVNRLREHDYVSYIPPPFRVLDRRMDQEMREMIRALQPPQTRHRVDAYRTIHDLPCWR